MGRDSRPPDHHGGDGVPCGLAGQLHVGTTHVPVVIVAHDGQLGRDWGREG